MALPFGLRATARAPRLFTSLCIFALIAPTHSFSPSGSSSSEYWWEEMGTMPFECTGCGKCCRVKGDVWVSPRDLARMAAHKEMDVEAFQEEYASRKAGGWVQLRDRGEGDDACIFLGSDDKTCQIYEARPLQCSVYPFFPRLLSTPEAWNGEVVTKDDEPGDRKWSPESGGCEGMREVKGVRFNQKKKKWTVKQGGGAAGGKQEGDVPSEEVMRLLEEYEDYFLDFPHEFLLLNKANKPKKGGGGGDGGREGDVLLAGLGDGSGSAAMPSDGEGGEKAELFYDQLFAMSSLMQKQISNSQEPPSPADNSDPPSLRDSQETGAAPAAVSGGSSGFECKDVVGRDGLTDSLTKQDVSIAKTLIAWADRHVIRLGLCPFAEPAMETGRVRVRVCSGMSSEDACLEAFLQEANRIISTPEDDLPTTLIALPDLHHNDFMRWNEFTENIEDLLEEDGGWAEVGETVLIAAFHPEFEFGGLGEEEGVLNYEKRAPVAVINLLRTEAIDRGIERGVTAERIAEDNERSLLSQGLEGVVKEYDSLGNVGE